jgi:hypothetical protein
LEQSVARITRKRILERLQPGSSMAISMGLPLALHIEAAIFTVPKHRNGNAMRKLFILTALVFAFFTGATMAIVGAAIHAQNTTAGANW